LIWFPEDSPHITVVGGTELKTSGTEGSWDSEAVWNFNYASGCANYPNIGGSGGISTQYEIPSWQSGVNMSGNQGSTTMRNMPDVALTADEVFIYTNGVSLCEYGTSLAAPLWEGLTALVNQQAAASGGPPVGFLNPALYAIGKGSHYSTDFHDIATGNNELTPGGAYFLAIAGYDLCTGWGTPAGQSLINDLSLSGSCLCTTTGALNTGCNSHTSTLLPNGLVLVAGGLNTSDNPIASAELYNSATGQWATTGSLHTARASPTATLLGNGLVLVAGGVGGSGSLLASAELYNPAAGTWAYTGSLNTAREWHTATLLPTDSVLVAGGYDGGSDALFSAELYNLSAGTWSYTASLNTERYDHTSTLLPSGFVLIAGGENENGETGSAELFYPYPY
jgi:hypothetical protein